MPKMKTHRGVLKRVKITASGKIKRKHAFTGHLMTSKNSKRKRHLNKAAYITGGQARNIMAILGK